MRWVGSHLGEIRGKIKERGLLLMLDFDGTLSPLAETPGKVCLSAALRSKLKKCATLLPVAVISGRALDDVKRKIGLKKLIYAGNHGLEWQIGSRQHRVRLANKTRLLLAAAKIKFKALSKRYAGALVEDKQIVLALHYRKVHRGKILPFKREAMEMIKPFFRSKSLTLATGKKVIELMPRINWDKGKFALLIREYLRKKYQRNIVPVYIGDDETDEHVYKTLSDAITIRVGKNKKSRARYYFNSCAEVSDFLEWIIKIVRADCIFSNNIH